MSTDGYEVTLCHFYAEFEGSDPVYNIVSVTQLRTSPGAGARRNVLLPRRARCPRQRSADGQNTRAKDVGGYAQLRVRE